MEGMSVWDVAMMAVVFVMAMVEECSVMPSRTLLL